ncbi:hypothetical protein E7V67_001970 [[Empedobacter] haloabium]|uniref:Uncharacterized protein n=1 Tax=[Empedobacter] haloabium TaxID=592317 RepID=A0ABZ1UMG7_9BURK
MADLDDVADRETAAASELLFALLPAARIVRQVEQLVGDILDRQIVAHLDGRAGAVAVVLVGGDQLRLLANTLNFSARETFSLLPRFRGKLSHSAIPVRWYE